MEYREISPKFASDFYKLVNHASHIVITSHKSPDEDSIASVLSIYELLSTKYSNKDTRILYSGSSANKYKIFKNFDKIEFVEDIADSLILNSADLLIMVDGGNFSRFSKKAEILKLIPHSICIDHHSSPPDKFTLTLIAHQYPSCVEVIYRSLFIEYKIDKHLAEIFLLGILGDTGNFTYLKPNQSETLNIAKKLIDIGQIEIQEFQSKYRYITQRVFQIIQELIKNTHYSSIENWPDLQYSFIKRSYQVKNNFTNNEISEASHLYSSDYIRTIEGYTWGFIATPNSNGDVNISCRSLPKSVNVRDLMERMKIGGGHDRASGGTFSKNDQSLSVINCVGQILDWLKANKSVLG